MAIICGAMAALLEPLKAALVSKKDTCHAIKPLDSWSKKKASLGMSHRKDHRRSIESGYNPLQDMQITEFTNNSQFDQGNK